MADASAVLARIPPPPRVPSPRARRLVYRYQGTELAMLIFGVVFAAVGIPAAIPFCWGLPTDLAVALSPSYRNAIVVRADVEPTVTIDRRHPTAVEFRYEVEGVEHLGRSLVLDERVVAAAVLGAPIPIEISTWDPTRARVAGTTKNLFGYAGTIAWAFPLIGFVFVFAAVRSNRREIRAFVFGRPAVARVVFVGEDRRVRVNHRYPFEVAWELEVDGKTYRGSLSSMNRADLEELSLVRDLPVLYDPVDPRRNTVYVE